MSKRISVIIIGALLIAGLSVMGGCQRAAERAVERAVEDATGVRVDEDGERVTITGSDGEELTIEGSGASLPSDWPSDVPVYPGTQLESSTSLRMGEASQLSASWVTSDDVGTVYEWYRSELPAAGWEITGDFSIEQNGERTANIATSKGSTDANVFIGDRGDGAVAVTIQVRVE